MRAFKKTIVRTVKSNMARFIAITAIILVGICFVSGIGAISPKLLDSFDTYLREQNISDIIIKTKNQSGFTLQEVQSLSSIEQIKIQSVTMIDAKALQNNSRTIICDIQKQEVNMLQLIQGSYPKDATECLVGRLHTDESDLGIGDKITFMGITMNVSGIVASPLFFAKDGEPSMINQEDIDTLIYIDKQFLSITLPITDIYVRFLGSQNLDLFSKEYKNSISDFKFKLQNDLGFSDEGFMVLTLNENMSYASLVEITNRVNIICMIFPMFFILVVALVVLTTMSRMIEEERAVIGCYKSLGYKDSRILQKYILFTLLCCIVGMGLGILIGVYFLPSIICPAFDIMFFLPALSNSVSFSLGVWSCLAMLIVAVLVTVYICLKELNEKPSELLRAKAPKAGKKIFLEYFPFLWNKLKFKYKSSLRNIFRYGGRLIMVIVSVAGSTALVMAGMGLYDISNGDSEIVGVIGNMASTLSLIALIVIIFAVALCVLVLYNLTNMNIGERKREIATLKVLGYHDSEVCGYIFREIFIMSIMGVAVGIGLGIAVLSFTFSYLDFGSVRDIHWYSYLVTGGITLLFIAVVDLLLYPKIKKIDMNTSLKTVD